MLGASASYVARNPCCLHGGDCRVMWGCLPGGHDGDEMLTCCVARSGPVSTQTICELLRDRGYSVPDEWLSMSLEEYEKLFGSARCVLPAMRLRG